MKKVFKPIGLILLSGILGSGSQMYATVVENTAVTNTTQQKKQVTGTVIDALGPVAGASVSIKGTTEGTITDMDGNFSLPVAQGATLSISFIGYVTQEIKYAGQAKLDIKLMEDTQALDEVVVTAMGIKKEKRALPYAMSELKSDELQMVPVQNVATSLYGKAAGVQIQQTAAGPTGGTKIQIRGINSVEGNTRPLIIVDGIPINDTDSNWAGRERSETQQGSALNDINPDDIETMSILKGANAAALYGSRATNGVIVITTKRGGDKKGLGIQVSTSYTYDQRAYMPEFQNVFGGGSNPYFSTNDKGENTYLGDSYRSFGPRMDGTEVVWWDGVKRPFSAQPNNYRDVFKDGFTNNNSISITNGTEKNNIRLGYTNMNYGGYLQNFDQNKHNFSFSGNFKVHERLTFDAAVAFNMSETNNQPTRIDRVSNYPMPRNEITQLWKDNYKNEEGYFLTEAIKGISSGNRDNILKYLMWQQNENTYVKRRERLIASLSANLKIADFLNFRLRGGTDRYYDNNENKEMFEKAASAADMSTLQGSYRKEDSHYRKNYVEGLLMFNKTFAENFDVTANLGVSGEDIAESKTIWESEGLKYNGIFNTENNKKDPKKASLDKIENKGEFLGAVFASAQLAYKRFLYLDLTARNDWSSRLAAGNRSFFYPSAGLSFVFSEVLDLPEWYNYGKIRGSYAIVGNTTPSIYFTSSEYQYETFNGSVIMNTFKNEVPPTNIMPEKTYSWELGLESRMFNGRLGFDFAYYTNQTKNQIITVPVTPSTGATGMKMNAGDIANHGVELQLTGAPVETKQFTWTTILNFAYTHNELISLIDGMEDRLISSPWSAANFKAVPGYATPSVFIKKWMRDDSGNMIVDKNGNYQQESEFSYAGSAAPKFTAGFTNTFRYRDFSLNVHIDGSFGGKLLSFTNNFLKSSGAGKESLFGRDEEYGGLAYYIDKNTNQKVSLPSHSASAPANALDGRVRHDGIIADGVKADGSKNDILVSAADYYNSRYNRNGSEDNLYDNTYIKLRELKLSYRIPTNIVSQIGLQNLNVSFVGSNLFFLYKSVPNINPEATLGTGGTNPYIEYTSYPSARSFGFAINASF